MSTLCALCGKQLSFFSGSSLVCANSDEMFCSKCHDKLYRLEYSERGRYVLEHGKPENPEKIRAALKQWDAEEAARKRATEQRHILEPAVRPCTNCGGEMKRELQNFRIGADGDNDLFDMLMRPQYHVDLYACPECGKVELYTANLVAQKARAARKAAEKEIAEAAARDKARAAQQEHTSYRPGRRSGETPPWEK